MTFIDVHRLGRTLVLAPHPDDETIGCGGLLALLGRARSPVQVVLFSDGTGSHRQSRAYPAARLRSLRRTEMLDALRDLGHGPECLSCLGWRDGGVPDVGEFGFDLAVRLLVRIAHRFRPETVVMPAVGDEHRDHRATHAIGRAACLVAAPGARLLDYVVWGSAAESGEALQIDIAAVLDDKRRALSKHRSQHGQVVLDDPQGLRLPPDLLARCRLPVETYFDTRFTPPERTIDEQH